MRTSYIMDVVGALLFVIASIILNFDVRYYLLSWLSVATLKSIFKRFD